MIKENSWEAISAALEIPGNGTCYIIENAIYLYKSIFMYFSGDMQKSLEEYPRYVC